MNKKQKTIATSMEKLLDRMYKAGLKGGVYGGVFCMWPENKDDLIDKEGTNFFDDIEKHGVIIDTHADIDGGAGI